MSTTTETLNATALRRLAPSEHEEQVRLFELVRLHEGKWPELAYLYAIPNGGHRRRAVAGKLKAEGVRAGYPDVGLDVARGGFHGLRIELKRQYSPPSSVSAAQLEWLARLQSAGYRAVVCRGAEEAWDVIVTYLAAPPTEVRRP